MENTQEETQSFNIDLASGMCDQARLAEQRRIITLLEREKPCRMKGTHHDIGLCSCLAIALIKGEK